MAFIGDENVKLEQEKEQVEAEMVHFREEYSKKFKQLKKFVGESNLQENSVDVKSPSPSDAATDNNSENQKGSGESSAEKEKLLRRQSQLEQTIGGLLEKYYKVIR